MKTKTLFIVGLSLSLVLIVTIVVPSVIFGLRRNDHTSSSSTSVAWPNTSTTMTPNTSTPSTSTTNSQLTNGTTTITTSSTATAISTSAVSSTRTTSTSSTTQLNTTITLSITTTITISTSTSITNSTANAMTSTTTRTSTTTITSAPVTTSTDTTTTVTPITTASTATTTTVTPTTTASTTTTTALTSTTITVTPTTTTSTATTTTLTSTTTTVTPTTTASTATSTTVSTMTSTTTSTMMFVTTVATGSSSANATGQINFLPLATFGSSILNGPISTAISDFNGDTRLDIAVANLAIFTISIFLGNGDGSFRYGADYSTGNMSASSMVVTADVNNDTKLDLIIANTYTYNIGVLLGNGDGTFRTQMTFSTGTNSYPVAVAIGDINKDGKMDIVSANSGTSRIGLFLGNGNGTFQTQKIISTGTGSTPACVIVGDLNNDTRLDIIMADYGLNKIRLYLGSGNGTFQALTALNYTFNPIWVASGDFNGDGYLDIVSLSYQGNTLNIFLGIGNGTFIPRSSYVVGNNSALYFFLVTDFDKNGQLDALVLDSTLNTIAILLGNGDGTLQSPVVISTGVGSTPYWVSVGDFNGDGRLDLILANYATNDIGVLIATG